MDILRYIPEQSRLWNSKSRFRVVPAGRRSGKSELAKRYVIKSALEGTSFQDARFFLAAPSRDQAKRIFWKDVKKYSPNGLVTYKSETELYVQYINGSSVHVIGLDKAERIEGSPWDGGVIDEIGNVKASAWGEHIRPALSDRLGWAWFIGVPEGRNHYWQLYKRALADDSGIWDAFTWVSADVLPAEEIESARQDLDQLTFNQEYLASFVNFTGQAYFNFNEKVNCKKLQYNPRLPLIFCFDFNVSPGVAVVVQEQEGNTCIIGEVHIPRNSNTLIVCDKLIDDWGDHAGQVLCYGDSTGGSSGSAKIMGSDWALIKKKLYGHFGVQRVDFFVPSVNPRERARVNSVNSRILTTDGKVHLYVDPHKAPRTVEDLSGVRCVQGGSGELDKKHDITLTHLSDSIGYYINLAHPLEHVISRQTKIFGV